MTNDEKKSKQEYLEKVASDLGEHFECVQIFCSSLEDNGDHTISFSAGVGNWYARSHQAREWVQYHDEMNRQRARKEDTDE